MTTGSGGGEFFLATALTVAATAVVCAAGYAGHWLVGGAEAGWGARTAAVLGAMTAVFLVIFFRVPRSVFDEGSWLRRLGTHGGALLLLIGSGVLLGYVFRDSTHEYILAMDGLYMLLLFHRILAYVAEERGLF